MTVSVIIPALNEQGSIGAVIAAIPLASVEQIIVVDGGSTDRTVEIAESSGAKVVYEANRGYGFACAAGLAAAETDVVLFIDGDGADDPSLIPKLVEPIFKDEADMVLGSRLKDKAAARAMPWHQHMGNLFAAWLIRRIYGILITDLSPFRAVKSQMLRDMNMQEMTYGWPTEMIVKAARQGWRLREIAVPCRPRSSGCSKISGTVRGTVLATYFIFKTIFCCAR